MSQAQAAGHADVGLTTIRDLEQGIASDIKLGALLKLGDAFELDLKPLVGGDVSDDPPALKEFLATSTGKSLTSPELRQVRALARSLPDDQQDDTGFLFAYVSMRRNWLRAQLLDERPAPGRE